MYLYKYILILKIYLIMLMNEVLQNSLTLLINEKAIYKNPKKLSIFF